MAVQTFTRACIVAPAPSGCDARLQPLHANHCWLCRLIQAGDKKVVDEAVAAFFKVANGHLQRGGLQLCTLHSADPRPSEIFGVASSSGVASVAVHAVRTAVAVRAQKEALHFWCGVTWATRTQIGHARARARTHTHPSLCVCPSLSLSASRCISLSLSVSRAPPGQHSPTGAQLVRPVFPILKFLSEPN